MPEKWTGQLIGEMHNHGVTRLDIGAELGVSGAYVGMVLNGKKTPKNAQNRFEGAFRRVCERKEEAANAAHHAAVEAVRDGRSVKDLPAREMYD